MDQLSRAQIECMLFVAVYLERIGETCGAFGSTTAEFRNHVLFRSDSVVSVGRYLGLVGDGDRLGVDFGVLDVLNTMAVQVYNTVLGTTSEHTMCHIHACKYICILF